MGYEAYDSLTNEIKLEKFGEKTMNKVLNALMDPGQYRYRLKSHPMKW